MAWQFYDTTGAIKRVTVASIVDATSLGGVASQEYVRQSTLQQELSRKSDYTHHHDERYRFPTVQTVTQNSIDTDVAGSWHDIAGGMTLTLAPGTWVVLFNGAPRIWQTGTAYAKGTSYARLVDSGVVTVYGQAQTSTVCEGEQSGVMSCSFSCVITTTTTLSTKVQVAAAITPAVNFAGGWRWDSGYGFPAVMQAIRVGGF